METWRNLDIIPGYLISDLGNIYSIKSAKLLKPYSINSGYLAIRVVVNGSKKSFLMHRLVAQAFCANYHSKLQVNHINANRHDNRAVNLEWVTPKENIHDTIQRGTHNVRKAQVSAQIKNQKPVKAIDIHSNEVVAEFDSLLSAKEWLGLPKTAGHISSVLSGKRKTAYGYRWEG